MATGLAVGGAAAAELSAAELVAACRSGGGAHDATGADPLSTAACAWYLDPCGVCVPNAPPVDWCVPDVVTTADRVALLQTALAADPGRGTEPAAEVVRSLWRQHFPCTPTVPP